MIEVTTPAQMTDDLSSVTKLEALVRAFDAELEEETKGHSSYHVVIRGEYSRELLDEIVILYTAAGWKDVVCKTSSENGERPGLTGLRLHK